MRLVTSPELPKLQVTFVIRPEHPDHRTLYIDPKQAIETVELEAILPGETVQIRIGGQPEPVTYAIRRRQLCIKTGTHIDRVRLSLALLWPRWDRQLDARLVCTLQQTNVARISLVGEERIDHYSKVPGLGPRDFALTARTRPSKRRLVHTPPQSA